MAVIGIDLGTTNSLAAYWKDGEVSLITDENGQTLFPSVVGYIEKEGFIVGRQAKERLITHGNDTVSSFKRFMGTNKKYFLCDREFTAMELSAMVLERIKRNAEYYLNEQIDEAIITVPAYFNDKQRSDTKKAAKIAGLKADRLINEPSAAALAYRMQYSKDDMTLLVFDFGGGTLDLSYVECFENIIEIVAVTGDNHLGGDDIDLLIAKYFCRENGLNLDELNTIQYASLIKCAETSKHLLEENGKTDIKLNINETDYSAVLNDDILFEICMPLFSKIRNLFLHILNDAGARVSDIDDLIMVGGSSKLKVVSRFLTELLGKKPIVLDDTDKVVAMGAGVYAGIRSRNDDIKDILLTDVCPFTLGVGCRHKETDMQSYLLPMIERNSTLPATVHKHFVTLSDYQREILVRIYQGEEYYANDNPSKTFGINTSTLSVQKENLKNMFKDNQRPAEIIEDTKIEDMDKLDKEDEDLSDSLLSRLQDFEEQEIRESQKKLKESKEKGALKKFISIFEHARENGKFPRADVWKEFFLSEEFLYEQYSYVFANGMMNYLSDWNMEGNYDVFQLPDSFLVELAIAFALMPEQEYMNTDSGRMIYHVNDTGFPARETAAYLWNNQQREYLPVRILYKNENLVRLRSFSDYIRLIKLNSQNALTEANKHVWNNLLTGGCVNHIYELNGKGQHNIYEHTRSITLIKLFTFWIQNNNVPDCILEYMYKEYDLRSIEHSSREKLYAPLKQAILTKYPDIEENLFGDESKKQMISSWYREFTKIIKEKETDFHKGIYEDSETIKNHVKQLFENGTWAKIRDSKELLEKLHLQLIGREALPKSLASHLIEFYSGNDLSDDDTTCRMLHNILGTLGFERKVMENNGVLPIIKETASINGISNDNIEFWSYYLMTGFDFRNVESGCLNGAYCCLPYYMKCMYYPSVSWCKLFTGVGETESSQPVATEFTLPDGKKLRIEFHLHYCLYFLDNEPVCSTKYTFEQCLEFSKHIEKTEYKFFLLAITSIKEEEQEQAVKIIEEWLEELKLYSFTIHPIACMLASDYAGILQDISVNSSKTDINGDDIKAVYYSENERFCFRAVVTTEFIILFYKSDFGWVLYDENIEKDKTITTLEQRHLLAKSALERLKQPAPVTLRSVSLDGMDNNQKAEKIIEALIYYGKFKSLKENQVPNETCYPWKKESISTPIKEFLGNMGNFICINQII